MSQGVNTRREESLDGGVSAPALRRAVRILDMIADAGETLTAAQIARLVGLPKSTAHGLITTMVELNLLSKTRDGSLMLGSHVMKWSAGFVGKSNMTAEFQRHFIDEPALKNYTVTLSVLDGSEVVYLSCRNSDRPLGFTFKIGMRLPAVYTATGKALLSGLPALELERMFANEWPAALTEHGVSNLAGLREEFDAIQSRGFSIDDGQVRKGMVCVGSVIRGHDNLFAGGIAISLMESEATPDIIARTGHALRQSADSISKQLGARV